MNSTTTALLSRDKALSPGYDGALFGIPSKKISTLLVQSILYALSVNGFLCLALLFQTLLTASCSLIFGGRQYRCYLLSTFWHCLLDWLNFIRLTFEVSKWHFTLHIWSQFSCHGFGLSMPWLWVSSSYSCLLLPVLSFSFSFVVSCFIL